MIGVKYPILVGTENIALPLNDINIKIKQCEYAHTEWLTLFLTPFFINHPPPPALALILQTFNNDLNKAEIWKMNKCIYKCILFMSL